MTNPTPSLKALLKSRRFPVDESKDPEAEIQKLQLKLLRIQQGIFHNKQRALVLFEGFDAAGKGGAIRRLTEGLDPRGVKVHAFGPPPSDEQGRHYFYRFFLALPPPGDLAVFDRTWYGRVLVERVERLTPQARWSQAYEEIRQLEKWLADDGVNLVKIFLAITPEEQLKRFEQRLKDPYKQWKITPEDIEARRKWDDYVEAAEEMLAKTHSDAVPWHLIPADHKHYARKRVLDIVTDQLGAHADWMEKKARGREARGLEKALQQLESEKKN